MMATAVSLAMAHSALRFTGFEPDELYDHHVKTLRRTVLYRGPCEAVYELCRVSRSMARHEARRLASSPFSRHQASGFFAQL